MLRRRPDLSGRVVVVTGANGGVGKATSLALVRMGATVIMAARDPEKGTAAAAAVRRKSGRDRVEEGRLDLGSFRSIHAFAQEVLDRHDRLDVLVNNAGLVLDRRQLTEQGIEMTFGVNHLGHFLLTHLLADRLAASAPARVVTLSSVAHRFATADGLRADPQGELGYVGFNAYCHSKLANVLFSRELARRWAGTGVTANACHPGIVRSGFALGGDTRSMAVPYLLYRPFLASPRRGARTPVLLASSPKLADVTGGYFSHRRRWRPSASARDDEAAAWLWSESERLVAEAG